MDIDRIKLGLNFAVLTGCGFEGDAKDAENLLSLITGLDSRIAELEAFIDQLIEAGNALETEAYDAWKKDGMLDFPAAEVWLRLVHSQKAREELHPKFPPVMGSGDALGW